MNGVRVNQVFVVHHNPNNGRYKYAADPADAVASAQALLAEGEGRWVAGNCRQLMQVGDLLLFKFGGSRLRQEPGIYAAAHITRAPAEEERGKWRLGYEPDVGMTRQLMRSPIVGRELARVVPRSFGASIQAVQPRGRAALIGLLREGALVADEPSITRGLLILKEPLDKILEGTKTWEIRGKATKLRGPIALIESKSGHVVGTCEVVDVEGPLSLAELQRNARRSGFRPSRLPYAKTYAWVVRNARRLSERVPYQHPSGAVIWVCLEPAVLRRVSGGLALPAGAEGWKQA
jgi:ASCH domain-containing protein